MSLLWHCRTAMVHAAIWLLKRSGWYEGYFNHWRTLFGRIEARGLHIMPVHYYGPIPDTRALPESLWDEPSPCAGVNIDWDRARTLLKQLSRTYAAEWETLPETAVSLASPQGYFYENSSYGHGDAEVLYAMIRHLRPRRIIEIGSGMTTLLIAEAIRRNRKEDADLACEFVAVEPFPPAYLDPLPAEVSRLERRPLQEVSLQLFEQLESGDLLFIDSSHVARIGSDVVREYLEIIPRLKPGVHVHVHDVFLPWDYPQTWVHEARFFWNEQYLLQAFLAFNSQFEVLLPLHGLSRRYPQDVHECLPALDPVKHRLQAFWFRRAA